MDDGVDYDPREFERELYAAEAAYIKAASIFHAAEDTHAPERELRAAKDAYDAAGAAYREVVAVYHGRKTAQTDRTQRLSARTRTTRPQKGSEAR